MYCVNSQLIIYLPENQSSMQRSVTLLGAGLVGSLLAVILKKGNIQLLYMKDVRICELPPLQLGDLLI